MADNQTSSKTIIGGAEMFEFTLGANDLSDEDIESFLADNEPVSPTGEENNSQVDEGVQKSDPTTTQTFARRLKEATTKARAEERNSLAKEFGYNSYEEMQKAKENDLLEKHGIDDDDTKKVIDELVNKRIAEDPRFKELEEFRQKKMQDWAQKELTELKELTGGEIKNFEDVPEDVIELWKTKGSLKGAYLELKGEDLIKKTRLQSLNEQNKGITSHLNNPQGSPTIKTNNERPFTQQEKDLYKMFNPNVTDEELNKMTKKF